MSIFNEPFIRFLICRCSQASFFANALKEEQASFSKPEMQGFEIDSTNIYNDLSVAILTENIKGASLDRIFERT
ncbi:MAG TPA: hypothetical protein VH500_23540 [Nitrososphaeraceae archaeon]|jgi:hypothetical protein